MLLGERYAKREKTNCSLSTWISSKGFYNPKHKRFIRVLGTILKLYNSFI